MKEIEGFIKGLDGGETYAFLAIRDNNVQVLGGKDILRLLASMANEHIKETGKEPRLRFSVVDDDPKDVIG